MTAILDFIKSFGGWFVLIAMLLQVVLGYFNII